MRIHILPVDDYLQPPTQGLDWPPDCNAYGVEQDFLRWLQGSGLVVNNAAMADWDYLPLFWNRWYLNHAEDTRRRNPELQGHIDRALIRPERAFTVCEYDPHFLQPGIDLHGLTVFTANRCAERGIDIPLLLHPHELPVRHVTRLASFTGHLDTHPLRREMQAALMNCGGCYVTNEPHRIQDYLRVMRSSAVALAPRGDGAQSFRFYEAMQAGVVPLYVSDLDARPFKQWLDWEAISLYRPSATGLCEYLHGLDVQDLLDMGDRAAAVYAEHLQYGQWCRYVVMALEEME